LRLAGYDPNLLAAGAMPETGPYVAIGRQEADAAPRTLEPAMGVRPDVDEFGRRNLGGVIRLDLEVRADSTAFWTRVVDLNAGRPGDPDGRSAAATRATGEHQRIVIVFVSEFRVAAARVKSGVLDSTETLAKLSLTFFTHAMARLRQSLVEDRCEGHTAQYGAELRERRGPDDGSGMAQQSAGVIVHQ
jgi:hypothetical protein